MEKISYAEGQAKKGNQATNQFPNRFSQQCYENLQQNFLLKHRLKTFSFNKRCIENSKTLAITNVGNKSCRR